MNSTPEHANKLPRRVPTSSLSYRQLIASPWKLLAATPLPRRRAAHHAALATKLAEAA